MSTLHLVLMGILAVAALSLTVSALALALQVMREGRHPPHIATPRPVGAPPRPMPSVPHHSIIPPPTAPIRAVPDAGRPTPHRRTP